MALSADERAAYQRAARLREAGIADELWICDLCGRQRTTQETLRVHRAIVHPKGQK